MSARRAAAGRKLGAISEHARVRVSARRAAAGRKLGGISEHARARASARRAAAGRTLGAISEHARARVSARCAAAGRTLGALVSTPHAYGRPACFGGPDAWRDQGARLRTPTDALLRPAPPGSRLKHEAPAAATRPDTTAPRPVQKR